MAPVTVVRMNHATQSAATDATPIPVLRLTGLIRAVRELLELWIGVDHLHVLIGHVVRRDRSFGQRAGCLHEIADLGHPAIDFGRSAGTVQYLELAARS